ncbi:MAG: NUDIX domain-containing protein [Chloroflexi bacterium]|nr:NUDIX domain-containing protein [Chloroflexota bacterium]
MPRFVLSASVFLHRDGEILILKRAGGYAGGGWFIPGGHIEFGESPLEAAVRETDEEAGIVLDPATLQLVGITTFFPEPEVQHHGVIYLAPCPSGAECVLNEEHTGFRWVTPEYYCSRFLDEERMRGLSIAEDLILTTRETRRVTEAVMRVLAAGSPA